MYCMRFYQRGSRATKTITKISIYFNKCAWFTQKTIVLSRLPVPQQKPHPALNEALWGSCLCSFTGLRHHFNVILKVCIIKKGHVNVHWITEGNSELAKGSTYAHVFIYLYIRCTGNGDSWRGWKRSRALAKVRACWDREGAAPLSLHSNRITLWRFLMSILTTPVCKVNNYNRSQMVLSLKESWSF